MKIERIIYPVHSLGPSNRVCVWMIGCIHNCFNCIQPELQTVNSKKNINVYKLANILIDLNKEKNIDSITFTGGDPMFQREELSILLELIRPYYKDILVYTGYLYEEVKDYTKNIDVLIDGKYIDNLNTKDTILRGSSNQKIYILNDNLKDLYNDYLKQERSIENFYYNNELISVGIHNKLEEN